MIRHILNLLMIVTVATCPLRCQAGMCCVEAEVVEAACCCSETPECEIPLQQSQDCCQFGKCFCAGATLPTCFVYSVDCNWVYLSDVTIECVACLSDNFTACRPNVRTTFAFKSGNQGRGMRCLYCSYLI